MKYALNFKMDSFKSLRLFNDIQKEDKWKYG